MHRCNTTPVVRKVVWEYDMGPFADTYDVNDEDSVPIEQHRLYAALRAMWRVNCRIPQDAIFYVDGHRLDMGDFCDLQALAALSFNGSLWFWTITHNENNRVQLAGNVPLAETLPGTISKAQWYADKYGLEIAVLDYDGTELDTLYPAKPVQLADSPRTPYEVITDLNFRFSRLHDDVAASLLDKVRKSTHKSEHFSAEIRSIPIDHDRYTELAEVAPGVLGFVDDDGYTYDLDCEPDVSELIELLK